MRSIGITVWLLFGVMLLGWYGLAFASIGVMLYLTIYLARCSYQDRKAAKRREEGGR